MYLQNKRKTDINNAENRQISVINYNNTDRPRLRLIKLQIPYFQLSKAPEAHQELSLLT